MRGFGALGAHTVPQRNHDIDREGGTARPAALIQLAADAQTDEVHKTVVEQRMSNATMRQI